MSQARAKIAIIGMGGIFPDASNAKTFWKNIVAGHVAISDVPRERWDPELFWSADRSLPDKTYSRIGGWVRDFAFDAKRFRIPPATLNAIDTIQRIALTVVAEALEDAGLEAIPGSGQGRPFDRSRVATIMGNAMGGEQEDRTSMRCWFPLAAKALLGTPAMQKLANDERKELLQQLESAYKATLPTVTEDSMAGELSNCITGRIANSLDLNGPNFTTDAACASSMAALKAAIDHLRMGDVDMAVVGGADQMMDPPAYVKFSKIGALSAEKSAPFDATANGFVMGEGVGALILKRLEDAERDGDKIYAVICGVGGSSDGKGKGIMAPNPKGQRLALERAYADASLDIQSVGLFEAHGTSTVVGDQTEIGVITEMLRNGGEKRGVPVGSVKSMIGHLKAAAGVASLIKTANALHEKVLPPSAGFTQAPPSSALNEGFLAVNTKTRPWESKGVRRAGVSSFGFGGINFHAVLEEYVPGMSSRVNDGSKNTAAATTASAGYAAKADSRSESAVGNATMNAAELLGELQKLFAEKTGYDISDLEPTYQLEADLGIDTVKQAEVLGIIRERYGIAREDSFKLSDTPTLQKVAEYLASRMGKASRADAAKTEQPMADSRLPVAESRTPVVEQPKADKSTSAKAAQMPTTAWTVVLFGGNDVAEAAACAQGALAAESTWPPACVAESKKYLRAKVRVAFAAENLDDARKKAADIGKRKARVLAAQGIFVSETPPIAEKGKMAFLFPGQGSQFLGMFKDLAELYPVVAQTFIEADKVLTPLLGKALTDICWAKADTDEEVAAAELALRQTEVCQPAMLTADVAMYRLLAQYGVKPDVVAGHSLGEYAACVAAGVLSFPDALYAVSARGREMAHVKVDDNGKMATVAAGAHKVEPIIKDVPGYVIAANKNCHAQTVIAGGSAAVIEAIARFTSMGIEAREIPVSHAFHSAIVAPAAKPLRKVLGALNINAPRIPILCNVDATYYPNGKDAIVDVMAKQLESPVEFIGQIERMYADGARLFVEVGPRRAVTGFVRNILDEKEYQAVATNHHKKAAVDTVMEALAALMCEGVAVGFSGESAVASVEVREASASVAADIDDKKTAKAGTRASNAQLGTSAHEGIVVSGCSIIVPNGAPLSDITGDNVDRMLSGQQFITPLSDQGRQAILDRNVARLDKSGGTFEPLRQLSEVVQLAARVGGVDLVAEYGLDPNFDDALDRTSRLAIAAGIDALRDAGLPLVRRYRTTSTGKQLPDRWALPPEIARSTGVIFSSAFPGVDRLIDEVSRQVAAKQAGNSAKYLRDLANELGESNAASKKLLEKASALDSEAALYQFNRKFLFRVLAMGHAQLAQTILAQGPNTQVNAACASGTQGIGIAADWIVSGRCDRVVVVTADDVTQEQMLPWFAAGFLAAGAATVEADVTKAAVPFGAGRNGMILGAGAAAFIVERDSTVLERGMTPLCELIATHIGNSAFHGTRLDSTYIREAFAEIIDEVVATEKISKTELAQRAFFMSHETYTPARGGSSAAEIDAIKHAFADDADKVLIANTKGYTGHPMGASLEDVVAIKALQRRDIPAIANLTDIDPAFAGLRFSRGEKANVDYAIHFAAGFGSQVAMAVFKRRAEHEARLADPAIYDAWLAKHAGRSGAGLEVVSRTLRVAEKGGVKAQELGIPSLAQEPKPIVVAKPVAVVSAVPARKVDRTEVLGELRQLFAEKTGYEVADLEPAYQLEADLGIDTVKQAEIMSMIRERYGFAKDETFKLAQVQTLDAVVDYVVNQLASAGAVEPAPAVGVETAATAPATQATPAKALPSRETLLDEIQALFAEKTGYERSDLEPAYQLEADLGVDTVKQAEIMSMIRERYGFAKDETFKLADVQTLNAVVDYVYGRLASERDAEPAREPVRAASPTQAQNQDPERAGPASTSQVPTAAASKAQQPAQTKSRDELFAEVLQVFVDKTGYEPSDLEPTYQLEADLGIDTVKQAEIMSMIRERYSLAKDDSFKLTQVQTLDAVVDYVLAGLNAPQTPPPVEGPQSPKSQAAAPKASAAAQTKPQSSVAKVLSLRDTLAQAKGFAARSVGAIQLPQVDPARSIAGRHVVLVGSDAVFRQAMREALLAQGANVHVVQPETLSDAELEARFADLGGQPADDLVLLTSEQSTISVSAIEAEVARAMRLARAFAKARQAGKGLGLLFAGRSNGIFGMHTTDASGLVMGALSGIAKSLAKEWPEARCLAIDLDRTEGLPLSCRRALECWMANAPSEIAVYKGELWTLRHDKTADASDAPLAPHAVVVATGGARGVTFELVRELARAQALRIVILARTGGVEESASPIKGLNDSEQKDRAKSALTAAGKRATPAEVKRWIENERTRLDITKNLESLRQLGSEVELIACDVADLSALGRVVDGIKARHGAVDLLVHGAGREESKFLADKDAEAFERVFAPKARAGLSLYLSLKPKRMLTMGSVAGRFGNAGQADYAASNELLAALSRAEGRDIVNVDWTAWGDVGMATKDAVKHVLESSGVEFLPAALGARLGAALALSTFKGDVVVAGELGLFAPADNSTKPTSQATRSPATAKHPAIFDRMDGNVYIRRLDPKRDIGLDHHRLDGVALLPGVLGLELMTQAAMHAAGGDAGRIENVKFASPVKLHRDEPLDARVEVTLKDGHAEVRLCTELVSPTGKSIRREHFSATVYFGRRETLAGPAIRRLEMPRDPGIERSAIYKRYFHGPVFQVLGRISVFGEDGAEAKSVAPWPTWMNGIGHQQLEAMPFAREAAFQAAGLWEMAELGRMALPAGIDRVELGAPLPAGTEVTVEARLLSSNANGSVFDVWTRDADGRIHDIMRGYRTVTLKQLAPEERFEPTYRRELTPNWLSVEIDEIHESLAADEQATLKRYLAPQEQARFKELKTDKRKIDWLAGRIVAKRLIRESHFAHDGAIVPYSAINIVPDELGAPQVSIAGEKAGSQRISISHSAGCAAAMLSVEPGVRPGIDVESVEARDPSFIRDYFTDAERAAAKGRDPAHLFTAVWAVKEAVVKALGIGARVDLREIEAVPRMSAGSETWHVTLSGEALQRAELLGAGTPRVELETMASRVVARVLMPVNEQRVTPRSGKPEVSA